MSKKDKTKKSVKKVEEDVDLTGIGMTKEEGELALDVLADLKRKREAEAARKGESDK